MKKSPAAFFGIFLCSALMFSSVPLLPEVSAGTEENYPFSGTLLNPYSLSGSSEITYSTDGTLIAAAFNSDVVIINTQYRTFIKDISIGNKILSLAFSDDDSALLVGLESPFMSTLAMAIYDTTTWERIGVNEDGREVSDISLLPSTAIFASANENNGVSEYYINDSTYAISTYDDEHTTDVTCLDHSPNGQQLVTGGKDGNINLWNRSSAQVDVSWQVGFSITDCSISPDGNQLAWITNSLLQVRTVPEGEFITTLNLIGDAFQLEWAENGQELWVLVESSADILSIFNTTDYTTIQTFELGHQVTKFAKSPTASEFIVTTNTGILTVFREDAWGPYYGLVGSDIDGDGTPDIYDGDDDGDGLGDDFEFSCEEGNDCHTYPDPDLIRQVSITINKNKITIQDRYQMNSSMSAPIRELASSAVASDGYVSQGEAIKMERMFCSGTNANQISSDWNKAVKFDHSAIIGTTVRCDAKLGLIDTEKHDSRTRIELRWFIEITLANNVDRPFNMTLDPSVSPPLHTVVQNVPTSPFTLTLIHEGKTVHYQTPIHVNSPQMSVSVQALPEPEPTFFDNSLSWLENNFLIPLSVIIVLSLVIVLVIRRKNALLFQLDEDEEDTIEVTSRRRSSNRNQSRDIMSSSGRPQPVQRPKEGTKRRKQPAKRPTSEPAIRRVRKVPGTVTQTGVAPEGEEWDYSEHGAYWDKDDPDSADPYREAQEFHDAESAILEIAQEVASEHEENENQENDEQLDSEMDDALSMIKKTTKSKTRKPKKNPEDVTKKETKKRRKVKRRKSD